MDDLGVPLFQETTISPRSATLQGILILIIKVYPNGRMSSYLGKMAPGEAILVSNPVATVDPADYPEAAADLVVKNWLVVWLPFLFSQKYWVANHPN